MIAKHLAGVEPRAVGDEVRGPSVGELDDERPQVILEARPPGELDEVAGLQGRGELARPATADETHMPATALDHHLGDDGRLAVTADADDQAFTAPLHSRRPERPVCPPSPLRGG